MEIIKAKDPFIPLELVCPVRIAQHDVAIRNVYLTRITTMKIINNVKLSNRFDCIGFVFIDARI